MITRNLETSQPDPHSGRPATNQQQKPDAQATRTLDRAAAHLRGLQTDEGWWKGELQTNITMDAEDLMLRHILDILTSDISTASARWIRSQQGSDGSWANFSGGPGDLSTTVEGWVALRLCGDEPDADHMRRAARFVCSGGGVEASRVFTRIWLALLGLWRWEDLPELPPELMFLPRWAPLNIYNWGCWARQTIVPLSVVSAIRPAFPVSFGIEQLRTRPVRRPIRPVTTVAGVFQRLDRLLHRYHRSPVRPVRRAAMRKAAEWILARQEADGSWGGIQPPWVYSILALKVMGYSLEHPSVRAALDGLDGFTVCIDGPDGTIRRLEACQSPVWDTALALSALLDAGARGDDPDLRRAARWLVGEQITTGGDWQVRRPDVEPGGWAFEFANDGYPDLDDSAEIILGLIRVKSHHPQALHRAVLRGANWITGMQSSDGGWGAFDADNDKWLATHLPFSDFGAVIDPPSADVTAHVVEMLAALGEADSAQCRRGMAWLRDHQETDGSWFGRWGANHIYGTGAAVPALIAGGVAPSDRMIRSAVRWLEDHQNPDGGWGEDLRSYEDRSWIGRGSSTPSQTAWALLALLAAGERESQATRRGVSWLAEMQRDDGGWDEDHYTGTGFPGAFYINYHLYRLVFPIWALGRYVNGTNVPAIDHDHADAEPAGDEHTKIAESGERTARRTPDVLASGPEAFERPNPHDEVAYRHARHSLAADVASEATDGQRRHVASDGESRPGSPGEDHSRGEEQSRGEDQ